MTDTPLPIDPAHTALLVMGYQLASINRLSDGDALLPRMATTRDSAVFAQMDIRPRKRGQ